MCQVGTAERVVAETDCVVCHWWQPWWALVAEGAAEGWQPWKARVAASAVAETGEVQVVSELLERATSFSAKPAAPYVLAPLSVAVFQTSSTAEQAAGSWMLCLPSTLLPWIMGYFGVPGAGPDLTACVSGRIFFCTLSSTATRQSFVWDLSGSLLSAFPVTEGVQPDGTSGSPCW